MLIVPILSEVAAERRTVPANPPASYPVAVVGAYAAVERLSASSSTKPAESRPQPTRLAFAVILLGRHHRLPGKFPAAFWPTQSPQTSRLDTNFHQPNNFIANYNLASIYYAENETRQRDSVF